MIRTLTVLPVVGLVGLVAGCGGSGSVGSAPVAATGSASTAYSLRVGFISTNQNWTGPEGYSYAKGSLKAVLTVGGVDQLSLTAFPNGPNLNQALQAGLLDIGIYGDTPALVGKAAGLDTRVIAQSSVGSDAWIVTAANGPTTVDKLAGKTVVVAQGSYIDRYVRGVLTLKGLTGKVKLVNIVPPPDQKAALDRGDVAAVAATATNGILLQKKGYRVIDKASADHPDLLGTGVTVITEAALKAHPQLPALWRKGRESAIDDSAAHAADYYAFQAQVQGIPLDVAQVTAALPQYPKAAFTPEGRKLIDGTAQFLVANQFAKKEVDLSQWFLP
ncbi:MAG TPA: ABC transporter substrate-binding protein [Kineosporiaceae bacterium]